jgi:hypothetical protein
MQNPIRRKTGYTKWLSQPARIHRHTPTIPTNDIFARSTSQKARTSSERLVYLFTDHEFGFSPGTPSPCHKLQHSKPDHLIGL